MTSTLFGRVCGPLLLSALLIASATFAQASEGGITGVPVKMIAPLEADNGGPAADISGIACAEPEDGERHCLVIDDEGNAAQWATLGANGLEGGDHLELLENFAPIGAAPTEKDTHCPKKMEFSDLDGEAVAFDGSHFYVAGSHGCARKGKFKVSAFVLARVNWETGAIKTTYRLADALQANDKLAEKFGTDLSNDGLNIEGVALLGGKLYAGLRAPAANSTTIVEVAVADLFRSGEPKHFNGTVKVHELDLADDAGIGIRDLSVIDGQLIALTGPSATKDNKELPFSVYRLEGAELKATLIGQLADEAADHDEAEEEERAKAEAILPLSLSGNRLKAIVLFDGIKGGGARQYSFN